MEYSLPKKAKIADTELDIRYDFRVMMDIFEVLAMDDLSEQEQLYVALSYFYPQFPDLPDAPTYQESVSYLFWFMNGGRTGGKGKGKTSPKLVSWADDFPYICSAVNRVLGYDCRGADEVHWWTFLGAYMEIGECFFSQIVAIRSKKAKNQKLDKTDQEFYKENKDLVDAVNKLSASDEAWIKTIL